MRGVAALRRPAAPLCRLPPADHRARRPPSHARPPRTDVTRKNPTQVPRKLQFLKYDPVVRQRVLFTERKMDSGKKR